MPLSGEFMFKKLTPLNKDQHRDLHFVPDQTYRYAAGLMVAPLTFGEARLIAREYPIVFDRTDALPLALLGAKPGTNAYVRNDGRWQARAIPAHVRCYPFMLMESAAKKLAKGKKAYTLMFDADAPQLADKTGAALFGPGGEPTPSLLKIQEILTKLESEMGRTRLLAKQIESADLLVERAVKIPSKQGKAVAIKGLRVIDAAKLAACSAETLHQLHTSGALILVYAHLLSLSNLDDGPLSEFAADKQPAVRAPISFAAIEGSKSS
jgi:hypothetical protein